MSFLPYLRSTVIVMLCLLRFKTCMSKRKFLTTHQLFKKPFDIAAKHIINWWKRWELSNWIKKDLRSLNTRVRKINFDVFFKLEFETRWRLTFGNETQEFTKLLKRKRSLHFYVLIQFFTSEGCVSSTIWTLDDKGGIENHYWLTF